MFFDFYIFFDAIPVFFDFVQDAKNPKFLNRKFLENRCF